MINRWLHFNIVLLSLTHGYLTSMVFILVPEKLKNQKLSNFDISNGNYILFMVYSIGLVAGSGAAFGVKYIVTRSLWFLCHICVIFYSAFLCHVCVSGMPLLQTGHTLFDLSHGSIHSVWSLCEHGRVLTSSPFFIGSRQTMHSYSVKSSFNQGYIDYLVWSVMSECPNENDCEYKSSQWIPDFKTSEGIVSICSCEKPTSTSRKFEYIS